MTPNRQHDETSTLAQSQPAAEGRDVAASVFQDARALARHLAARLPAAPTEAEILELAAAVGDAYPQGGRALAKHVERNLKTHDLVLVTRVREAAKAHGASGVRTSSSNNVVYCDARVAAEGLGVPVSVVRRMLRRRDGRYSLGWPVHIGGGSFRIPRAAVDPATRSQFLASLSVTEPPHPEPLPEPYER